jgi:hypothetical protein
MKKLLFLSSVLMSSLLFAQTPNIPFSENFDAIAVGSIPSGWTTDAFAVMANNHGVSGTQAITSEMKSTHTADTLTTPLIGPLTATTVVSLQYRIAENVTGIYPQQTASLVTGDQILVQVYIPAYAAFGWSTVTTINTTSNPPLASSLSFTTYSYSTSAFPQLSGQYVQLRLIVDRGATSTSDYFLDIDNFTVGNAPMGIKSNTLNAPSLSVFPNPSNGNFAVSLKNYQINNQAEVNIYNLLGQKVKTVTSANSANKQINISSLDLEKGMYIIEVKSGSEVANSKIQID